MKYWIAVASKDHVKNGEKDGFAQVCHGKANPLKRMKKDDWIIYYSPKNNFQEHHKDNSCKSFTAIGQVKEDTVYQVQMFENFFPFRININYYPSKDASILPLIENLEFITDKKNWGYKFRFGILEINKKDFELIQAQMLNLLE